MSTYAGHEVITGKIDSHIHVARLIRITYEHFAMLRIKRGESRGTLLYTGIKLVRSLRPQGCPQTGRECFVMGASSSLQAEMEAIPNTGNEVKVSSQFTDFLVYIILW